MKKIYLKPEASVFAIKTHRLLSSSNVRMVITGNDIPDVVIEYGGIDEEGEYDPD